MLIKIGNLIVSREKSTMSTVDDVPERFPIRIAFPRKLTDEEMLQLAGCALLIESGETQRK